MKYIDIHSHLGFEDYGSDLKDVITRMNDLGVGTIAVGADLASSKEAVKVATGNKNIWACIGLHPNHNLEEIFDQKKYEELVMNNKVVAIGECGLDYFSPDGLLISEIARQRQKENFIKQVNFALKYNKALMLHIRNVSKSSQDSSLQNSAFDDVLEILNKIKLEQGLTLFRGNVHFFTGKLEQAQKFIDLGFTISFVGLITYVHDFDKIIKNVPLKNLQAETDAPYVSPVPYRGARNEPSYVIPIYKKIAEIRGEDPEMVRFQLLENAKRVFEF